MSHASHSTIQGNYNQAESQEPAKFSSLSFLNQESYQQYNRHIANFCNNVYAAIMLSELVNRRDWHAGKNELISHEKHGDGWFYHTVNKAEERTCLTAREQESALKILKEKDLIECISFGLPAKRHFRLKENNILKIFGLSNNKSSYAENAELDTRKTRNCIREKRVTAPYIEEHKKEPVLRTTTTTRGSVVAVVHNSSKEEAAKALKGFLDNRITEWGPEWYIPIDTLHSLIDQYNESYVSDQVSYILEMQNTAMKDQKDAYKKRKKETISRPESYLRLACEKNFAISKNYKKR